jgi:hypothetical protein
VQGRNQQCRDEHVRVDTQKNYDNMQELKEETTCGRTETRRGNVGPSRPAEQNSRVWRRDLRVELATVGRGSRDDATASREQALVARKRGEGVAGAREGAGRRRPRAHG